MIVIYTSETGFTEKYAKWIAEELGCETAKLKDFTADKLNDYEVIIYGGNINAFKIVGINLINNNLSLLEGKKVYVFGSGITPYSEQYESLIAKNNLLGNHQFYYFTGGLDKGKLKFSSRFALSFIAKRLKTKKNPSSEELFFVEANKAYTDTTSKEQINRLITDIKTI